MKQVAIKDLKPGYYWMKDQSDGSLDAVEVALSGESLRYFHTGIDCAWNPEEGDLFYELAMPVEGEINLVRNEYDGESIVDMERDISECLDADYNPAVSQIPEMEDSPGFWAGKFVVDITWVPDDV